MVISLLALLLTGCKDDPAPGPHPEETADTGTLPDACEEAPSWSEAQGFVRTWCLPCHSANVAGEERHGAPIDSNFDTYAQVFAWRAAIEQRATGPDLDMPPVPGADDVAVERFAEWLACGAEGDDPNAGPCDTLTPVGSDVPTVIATTDDANALCAAGNQAGDLEVRVDVPCLCAVTGDLSVEGAALDLLDTVDGDLTLVSGAVSLPVLRTVGGSVDAHDALASVEMPQLEAVGGDLVVHEAPALEELDLSGVLTVDGALELFDLAAVHTIDLSRLRVVGGPMRLSALPELQNLEGLIAVESIGRGPVEVGGTPTGADLGGIELSAIGPLTELDAFRLLTSVGGEIAIERNPNLVDIDGFTTLPTTSHPVRIADNPRLVGLEGFDLLAASDDLHIVDNVALVNVFGFVNLADAGEIRVEGSPALRSLFGLAALEHADGLHLVGIGVQDIPWFTRLETIDGDLQLSATPTLGRVTGFTALTEVTGDIAVTSQPVLLELAGPSVLEQVGGSLVIDTAPDLRAVELFGALSSTGEDLRLLGTGLSDLQDLADVATVGGDLQIQGNPSLPSAAVDAFAAGVVVDGTTTLSDNGP